MPRKEFSFILRFLQIGVSAAVLVLADEMLARHSLVEVIHWIKAKPAIFALNAILSFTLLALLVALTGRIMFGLFAGAIFLLMFGVVNALKLSILQAPLFAWDFLYVKQMIALGASFIPGKAMVMILISVLLGFFLFGLIYTKHKSLLPIRHRLALLIASAVIIGIFSKDASIPVRLFHIDNIVWDQAQNYSNNGILLAFSMNVSPLLFNQPEAYDRELVCRLFEHNAKLEDKGGLNGKPISLIFFMSESFSDLADPLFETLDNPLKNLKQLASRYPGFRLISPTYAGNTSLVEFEVLTGLSNAFLPSGAIPFDHYLRKPTPSLAWILREHGYRTIAIHPFYEWFWSRNTVYPNLGFQEYISISQFDESAKRGFYISDEELVDKIIEVVDSTFCPYFLHVVSMENHGPYYPNRYDQQEIEIGEALPEGLRSELVSYIAGLQDADKQLIRLLTYLKSREEPVICLFFGDHQPSFGLALYNELGRMKEGVEKEYQMSAVPGLLWANRKGIIDAKDIPEQLSPVYLPAIVLHQMGIPLPGYMFYLQNGISFYPVVHRNFVIDSSGRIMNFNEQRMDPYLRGLEVLNYDVLFGSRYSWQL